MSALTESDIGNWHVSAALKGDGSSRVREFVYYVQRYVRPQEGRRYNGDVATRTWDNETEAQKAADEANARPDTAPPFNIRSTYL